MSTLKSNSEVTRVYKAVPQFGRLRDQVLFGDVWKQPELAHRDRVLVTLSVLAATGKLDELKGWRAPSPSCAAARPNPMKRCGRSWSR